jgi:ERCC4-type nuclease
MWVLGQTSPLPERYGVDVLFEAPPIGLVGVQRKTFPDLMASIRDGRIARGVVEMRALDLGVLVIEGEPAWGDEGYAVPPTPGGLPVTSWHREQYRSLLWSVQAEGIWVEQVPDITGTVAVVRSLERWCRKTRLEALLRRAGPRTVLDPHARARYLLQSLPGIGPRSADAILQRFGGLPFAWRITEEELATVPGFGRVRAQRLFDALPSIREEHADPAETTPAVRASSGL